jgi:hypothetical protein
MRPQTCSKLQDLKMKRLTLTLPYTMVKCASSSSTLTVKVQMRNTQTGVRVIKETVLTHVHLEQPSIFSHQLRHKKFRQNLKFDDY